MQVRGTDTVLELGQATGEADSSRDHEDEALIPEQPRSRSCGCTGIQCRHVKTAAHIFPLASALSEGIETAMDLLDKPNALAIPVILVNAASTFGINEKFQNDSIEDAAQIIQARGIPDDEDWPQLTKRKEVLAISASTIMSLYTAFCDGAVTVHYSRKLPAIYNFSKHINTRAWTGASIGFGIVRGSGVCLVEGMETWKLSRQLLAGTKTEYRTTLSRILSPTLGFALGVFGSLDDAVLTWSGVVDVFEITSFEGRLAFTIASIPNGFTDYCLNGTFDIQVVKDVLENTQQNYKDPKIIAAFILALASGALAGYVYQGLVVEAMEEWLEAFDINYKSVTGPVVEICADMGAASMVVNAGGSIFPLFRKGIDLVCGGASYVYTKIKYCCCVDTAELEEFFADAENDPEADEIDVESLLATAPIAIPVAEDTDQISDEEETDHRNDEDDDIEYYSLDEDDGDNLTFHFEEEDEAAAPKAAHDFLDAWDDSAEFIDPNLTSSGEGIPHQIAASRTTNIFLHRLFAAAPINNNNHARSPSDDEKDKLTSSTP